MLLLVQAWFVLTAGLLTAFVMLVGAQNLVRLVRRTIGRGAQPASSARSALRIVQP